MEVASAKDGAENLTSRSIMKTRECYVSLTTGESGSQPAHNEKNVVAQASTNLTRGDNGNPGGSGRQKPGPAYFKGNNSNPSSRRNFPASTASTKSAAARAAEEARQKKRELDMEVRRLMARPRSTEGLDIDSEAEYVEDSEEDRHTAAGGTPQSVECLSDASVKSLPETKGVKRKKGRPLTSEDYVQLAAKKKVYNDEFKVEEELKRADRLRQLSNGELYSNLGLDLDAAVEDLK